MGDDGGLVVEWGVFRGCPIDSLYIGCGVAELGSECFGTTLTHVAVFRES
jgi:hypothetical protein